MGEVATVVVVVEEREGERKRSMAREQPTRTTLLHGEIAKIAPADRPPVRPGRRGSIAYDVSGPLMTSSYLCARRQDTRFIEYMFHR